MSLDSASSEDWDRSIVHDQSQSSITFPGQSSDHEEQQQIEANEGEEKKRKLSELLKRHAEKGTDCRLSADEANRLGEVLGQWVCLVYFFLELAC